MLTNEIFFKFRYKLHMVKNLPAMQETSVQFLGWEGLPEKGKATHCNILGLPLWLSW